MSDGVEGYGERNPEYDGPYLDGLKFEPSVQFAFGGDPEKQAELQKIIDEHDGQPVMVNGVLTIKTGEGEPNVVILTSGPADTKTIVLEKSRVDELREEAIEAELAGAAERDEKGDPVNSDDVVDLDGPSGKDETRDGADYNPTAHDNQRDEGNENNATGVTLS